MQDSLHLSSQFAIEAHSRAIDSCTELEVLREMAKSLLNAWQVQAMFSEMYGAQALGIQRPSTFRPDASHSSIPEDGKRRRLNASRKGVTRCYSCSCHLLQP